MAMGGETVDESVPRLKRTRVSGPKVKTGCITCKIRRVKCDEGKPACVRCTSTGRTCDGYVIVPPPTKVPPRPLAPKRVVVVSSSGRKSIPRLPELVSRHVDRSANNISKRVQILRHDTPEHSEQPPDADPETVDLQPHTTAHYSESLLATDLDGNDVLPSTYSCSVEALRAVTPERINIFPYIVSKRHAPLLNIPPSPSTAISTDGIELRGFYYYQTSIGLEFSRVLSFGISESNWDVGSFLRITHHDTAMKHAAIALGLLGERFEINELTTTDNIIANDRHAQAEVQYQKAMGHLQLLLNRDDDLAIESALKTCLVLCCYEFLQGNEHVSPVHLRMGYQILNMWLQRMASESGTRKSSAFVLSMIRIFSNLDIQGAVWLKALDFIAPSRVPIADADVSALETPNMFVSLREAVSSLNCARVHTYMLHRSLRADPSFHYQSNAAEIGRRQSCLARSFAGWAVAMDRFEAKKTLSVIEQSYAAVLRLSHRVLQIIFRMALVSDLEEYYGIIQDDLADMLAEIQPLITPDIIKISADPTWFHGPFENGEPAMRLFTFGFSLAEPLYFIAITSRDPAISSKAISLLQDHPWREGAWDSASLGRIAARLLATKNPTLLNVEVLPRSMLEVVEV